MNIGAANTACTDEVGSQEWEGGWKQKDEPNGEVTATFCRKQFGPSLVGVFRL
jgi:hypothetical protein